MSETENPEDDKVYVFFTERAQEAEGAAGKVLYSRVARVCKVSIFNVPGLGYTHCCGPVCVRGCVCVGVTRAYVNCAHTCVCACMFVSVCPVHMGLFMFVLSLSTG